MESQPGDFNRTLLQLYKIDSSIFDVWMSLLRSRCEHLTHMNIFTDAFGMRALEVHPILSMRLEFFMIRVFIVFNAFLRPQAFLWLLKFPSVAVENIKKGVQ